jgi:hypothetical protein
MPAMDGGSHIAGVEAEQASPFPRHPVTQRDRSCAGKTTERGTGTCLNDRSTAGHITWHDSVPRPIPHAKARGSGDVHGQTTGRKGSRERGAVSWIWRPIQKRWSALAPLCPAGHLPHRWGEWMRRACHSLSSIGCSALNFQFWRGGATCHSPHPWGRCPAWQRGASLHRRHIRHDRPA